MKIYFNTFECSKGYQKDIKNIFKIALRELGVKYNLSCNIVDLNPEEIKELNSKYRNVDRVTDVLSFPLVENFKEIEKEEDFALGECNIGDIYINPYRAREQSIEYGHSERREYCFLALHGLLHLLGFDHMTKDEEIEMFSLQDTIMKKANIGRD